MNAIRSLALLALPLYCQTNEAARIAELKGEPQQDALLRVFSAGRGIDFKVREEVFRYEAELRPALRALATDARTARDARSVLTTIAVPDDIRFLAGLAPVPDPVFPNRSLYPIVCALLEPNSEEEWELLRRAARNEFKDRWVDAGAIQTLRLIASTRSEAILAEAGLVNEQRKPTIQRSLDYIRSKPVPIQGPDLEDLAKAIADRAVRIGKWVGNESARYNQAGDKAVIDFRFEAGEDDYTYTATFHKVDQNWKLRGVRETLQTLVVRSVK